MANRQAILPSNPPVFINETRIKQAIVPTRVYVNEKSGQNPPQVWMAIIG